MEDLRPSSLSGLTLSAFPDPVLEHAVGHLRFYSLGETHTSVPLPNGF